MGTTSGKTFDTSGAIGLNTTPLSQLEATLTSHHTTRRASDTRRRSTRRGDAAACGDKAKIGDFGAMLASGRGAVNMRGAVGDAGVDHQLDAERSAARHADGLALAGSNTLAEQIGSAVDAASANTTDSVQAGERTPSSRRRPSTRRPPPMANKAADRPAHLRERRRLEGDRDLRLRGGGHDDKAKAKATADSRQRRRAAHRGSNADRCRRSPSAGVTGDPRPARPRPFESALKKLASAMAGRTPPGPTSRRRSLARRPTRTSATIAKAAATLKLPAARRSAHQRLDRDRHRGRHLRPERDLARTARADADRCAGGGVTNLSNASRRRRWRSRARAHQGRVGRARGSGLGGPDVGEQPRDDAVAGVERPGRFGQPFAPDPDAGRDAGRARTLDQEPGRRRQDRGRRRDGPAARGHLDALLQATAGNGRC